MKEIGLVLLAFVAFYMCDKMDVGEGIGILPLMFFIVSMAAIAKAAWILFLGG